jgi:ketosteroid isomerase-like protein
MTPNEQLILDLMTAVETRNAARVLELYHDDVEFLWPPSLPVYGGTYRGRAVLDMNAAFAATWDPLQPTAAARHLDARIVASKDDDVVVLYHQRGVDASGRLCDSEVLGRYTVEDGKVRRLQMFYFDPEQVSAFLNASGNDAPMTEYRVED